jgi:hypothetical protein
MEKNQCKNCESILNGKFCSNCGQKIYNEKDKSLTNLFHEVFHFMTHFDGKLIKTLKTIYLFPGKLSLDYSNGIRQKYYKPISLYLLIVVLYLLFPVFEGMNVNINYYKEIPIVGSYISKQIENKSLEKKLSKELLSAKFNEKSKNTSKFLLILLIPLTTPLLYLLYFNRKRFAFDNFILLTEINTFFLFSFYIIMPIIIIPIFYLFKISMNDNVLTAFCIVIFSLYSIILFYKVFNEKWWVALLKGGIFAISYLFTIFTIYRVILFETTFALI